MAPDLRPGQRRPPAEPAGVLGEEASQGVRLDRLEQVVVESRRGTAGPIRRRAVARHGDKQDVKARLGPQAAG
jgi:hypothetical protein